MRHDGVLLWLRDDDSNLDTAVQSRASCHEMIPQGCGEVGYHTDEPARNGAGVLRVSDRSQRVETDVNVYRLRLAAVAEGSVVFGWDYPGSTLLRVRIVRADVRADDIAAAAPGAAAAGAADVANADAAAPDPEPAPGACWRIVYDGDAGSFRDRDVRPGSTCRYAVFARAGDGPWVLWRDEVVTLP